MYFATTVPHYRRVIDVRFYVSVVEDFFGVDVDMLQLRKEKHLLFVFVLRERE